MDEYQLPEMLRAPLEELILQIKILKLGMAFPFLQKAIEPPSAKAVWSAINCLRDLVNCVLYRTQPLINNHGLVSFLFMNVP